MPTATKFERVLASDLTSVRLALKEALDFVRGKSPWISDDDFADLRLVIWELTLNAAIHGNALCAEKIVRLFIEFDGEAFAFVIEDEGEGFDYRALVESFSAPDFESEHGRGVRLAYALMDRFTFNEKGNRVSCAKRVAAKPEGGA
jgi:serine/threonine-protein kinase RsbW